MASSCPPPPPRRVGKRIGGPARCAWLGPSAPLARAGLIHARGSAVHSQWQLRPRILYTGLAREMPLCVTSLRSKRCSQATIPQHRECVSIQTRRNRVSLRHKQRVDSK